MSKAEKRLWFRNKAYGWGWVPATWQGWAILGGYTASALLGAWLFLQDAPEDEFGPEILMYLLFMSGLSILLVVLASKTGEKPEWRWGGKPTKKK